MQLTSEQWKNGIANSHYTGVANLRNVRIDDEGVLRVMNKPAKIREIPGEILEIHKGYYDISNEYYAVVKSVGNTLGGELSELTLGSGALYQSKNNSYLSSGNGAFSGGMVWRDYFFPLPTIPNTDEGIWTDTNNDGRFNLLSSSFETLITKGQTQSQFTQQFSPVLGNEKYVAMITNDKFVVTESQNVFLRDKDGTLDATIDTSGYTATIQDVTKVSDTAFGVVTTNTIYVYNLSGTLLASIAYDFSKGNSLQHAEAKQFDNNEIVVLGYSIRFDSRTEIINDEEVVINEDRGFLEFTRFDFNGSNSITNVSRETLFSGDDGEVLFNNKPHISAIDNTNIVTLFEDGTQAGVAGLYVSTASGLGWNTSGVLGQISGTDYAPMDSYDNGFILFGNKTYFFTYDGSFLQLGDSTIIAPNNIKSVGGSGDFFVIKSGLTYSVYKFTTGTVDSTPTIIIRDTMYWANGSSIASLQERGAQDTFDPDDSDTYTLLVDALDLPLSTKITALADIGLYMAIGTDSGKIFFWDLNSAFFDIPVNIGEPIGAMSSKNNLLYITSQKAGNVYIANLSSYQKNRNLCSLTKFKFDAVTKGMEFFDDGAYMGAKIINDDTYTGIWVFKNGAWSLIGTEEQVTAIGKSAPNKLVYATLDGIYELDIAGTAVANWTNDDAYIVSNMEITGTVANKGKQGIYSMYFDNAFGSGEYVKLFFRTTTTGEWQHIETVTSEQLVADSGLFAFKGQLGTPKTEQIQYKIVMNTTAGLWKFETN